MKFKRTEREEMTINMTPLIDVVFLLLIFFMVTTTFSRETRLMVNLRSPFARVGPPTTWEGRAAHLMKLVRDDVATPLADDEFTA